MFKNREEAGKILGEKLKKTGIKTDLVLAIPRGGVVVGKIIAAIFNSLLDIVVARKLTAPYNPELAIGAVAGIKNKKGWVREIYWEEEILKLLGIGEKYKEAELKVKIEELETREKILRGERPFLEIEKKRVVLTDDGIATGATVIAVLRLLKKFNPYKIILAVPVLARETLGKMEKEVEEIIYLSAPEVFYAVGQFYEDFREVSNEEVKGILKGQRE